MSVRLRPTIENDLPFVLEVENAPEHLPCINQWHLEQHRAALAASDMRHYIVEDVNAAAGDEGGARLGYIILMGIGGQDGAVLLKRIVVVAKGLGHGKAALRAAERVVFDELGAERLWLMVRQHNERARRLYESESFLVEGSELDPEASGEPPRNLKMALDRATYRDLCRFTGSEKRVHASTTNEAD